MTDAQTNSGTVAHRLRLGPGFTESDQEVVVRALGALNRHLEHWRVDQVDLRISVRDRDYSDQRVTLEIWLPGRHSLLAHAVHADLPQAIVEVRKIAIREIEDEFQRL